jgi:hypothetical protein
MSSKESCNLVFWAPKWGMIVGPGAITCSFFGLIALEHPGVCVWTMLMGIVITFLEWGNAPCCYKVTKAPAKMHALFLSGLFATLYYVRSVTTRCALPSYTQRQKWETTLSAAHFISSRPLSCSFTVVRRPSPSLCLRADHSLQNRCKFLLVSPSCC